MKKTGYIVFLLIFCLISCNEDTDISTIEEGALTRRMVQSLNGFEEEKMNILNQTQTSDSLFIALSTDSAWTLSTQLQAKIKEIRDRVSKPDTNTLLQKIIPLDDVANYMNNKYTSIGGFVCKASDVKFLSTIYDVFWGLRLDYSGTKFSYNGPGYAVIRFYSQLTSHLTIPYSPELGGNQPHSWPNGGGGFTTSTLGKGGYPEWTFDSYYTPKENAELYEVTPAGREILRSVFKKGKWETYESQYYPIPQERSVSKEIRNGVYGQQIITTYATYQNKKFIVRSSSNDGVLLVTQNPHLIPGLQTIEKGIYGINIPTSAPVEIYEEEHPL